MQNSPPGNAALIRNATWAGFRIAGERSLRFFDNLHFLQYQQVCAGVRCGISGAKT